MNILIYVSQTKPKKEHWVYERKAHVLSAHEAQIVTYNNQLKLGFISSDTV